LPPREQLDVGLAAFNAITQIEVIDLTLLDLLNQAGIVSQFAAQRTTKTPVHDGFCLFVIETGNFI
jgi:hypothetical protein